MIIILFLTTGRNPGFILLPSEDWRAAELTEGIRNTAVCSGFQFSFWLPATRLKHSFTGIFLETKFQQLMLCNLRSVWHVSVCVSAMEGCQNVCFLSEVFQLRWPGVPEGPAGHPDTRPGQGGGQTQEERGGMSHDQQVWGRKCDTNPIKWAKFYFIGWVQLILLFCHKLTSTSDLSTYV